MSLTVHEVLKLKRYNNFRLIAGANGLDRKVLRGGFIDHELPEEMINPDFEHELIFSNLPMIKNDPEMITEYVNALIEIGSAGFAVKTIFFDAFPESAIELANKHNFPLFLFDKTYIEKLVIDIEESVNSQKKLTKLISLVEQLETGELNSYVVKNSAYEINKYFKDNIVALYIYQSMDSQWKLDFKLIQSVIGKSSLVLPFEETCLLILSCEDNESIDVTSLLNAIGVTEENSYIGISNRYESLINLDKILYQSKIALKFARHKDRHMVKFDDIGIYKMLIPVLDNAYVVEYYDDIIEKLKGYDKKHQSELLMTAQAYIKSDGDIKRTAEGLYQHTNTIRYRIRKINEILDNDVLLGMKYETLSMAIHLYELNMNRSKFRPL